MTVFNIVSFILLWWLRSLPIAITGLFIFFAYANQAGILEKLDHEGNDITIVMSVVFWPLALIFMLLTFILWVVPNKIFALVLKNKETKEIEVKSLTGAELDALLTTEYMESKGWVRKD